jgi:hypothetical protein
MKTPVTQILVDLENVPHALSALEKTVDGNTVVFVFHNKTHEKRVKVIKTDLEAKKVTVKFLKLDKPGANALDFHMTFFLGWELRANPKGRFLVFTNDTGFDSLIDRLRKSGKDVTRVKIAKPSKPKKTSSKTAAENSANKTTPATAKKKASAASKSKPSSKTPKKAKSTEKAAVSAKKSPSAKIVPASATELERLAKDYFDKHNTKPRPRTLSSLKNDIKQHLKKHKPTDAMVDKIIVCLSSLGLSPRSAAK